MEKKDPVEEARRYVDNAKKLLVENGELDTKTRLYGDRKYVKMAGNTLWNGVLYILDAVFHVRKDRRTHVDIDAYREAIAKRDKKLLAFVNSGYETMHIYMGYDGTNVKDTCDAGIRLANQIIDRCVALLRR